MNQNECPISDNGNHRYFIFKTYEVFEPYRAIGALTQGGSVLYEKVEYATIGCNCGSVLKQKVRNA